MRGIIEKIKVQNLKCGGCSKTISKHINAIIGVTETTVDVENALVEVKLSNVEVLHQVLERLGELGYPSVDESNSILTKAKSFVSCASGKFV